MKNAILIVGAVVGCVMGASLGACSSGGSTGTGGSSLTSTSSTTSTSTSSGTTTTSTTSATTGTGGSTSTSSTTGAGGSAVDAGECGKIAKLYPPYLDAGPATIYCPYSAVTDGGPEEYCTPGTQHCCETPSSPPPSACQPIGTACMTGTGYTDWQCEDPVADCTTALPVCCAPGATLELGTPAGTCGNYASHMTHTTCTTAAACPASANIIMCTSNAECPAATPTCTAFYKAGNSVGGCM